MEQHAEDPKPMVHTDDQQMVHTDDPKPHNSRVIGHQRLSMRMSVRELEKPENSAKRNAFLRAWKRIQELPPDNPNSFWAIAGFHGEPFRAPYYNKPDTWGGYCQHSTVLFPTWHRYYLVRLEQALQTVCPEDDIAMAYWDATSEESLEKGLPKLLTDEMVEIDGKLVNNPLARFVLTEPICGDNSDTYYSKPKGYHTCRYPFSGICSPMPFAKVASAHNEKVKSLNIDPTVSLNENIKQWLNGPPPHEPLSERSTLYKFRACLEAQSYNKFSNTDSSANYLPKIPSVALESPHNDLHLAIGGFDLPGMGEFGQINGANGDMGENETAAFDPIFFFHHCNIDRVFWVWQKKHGKMGSFEIDPADHYGTIASLPTVDEKYGETLTMDTPLAPFQHANGVPVTSKDCININDLGYDYTIGSLDQEIWPPYEDIQTEFETSKTIDDLHDIAYHIGHRWLFLVYDMKDGLHFDWNPSHRDDLFIKIGNINRDKYSGSKLLRLYYRTTEPSDFIGQVSILSRWNRELCDNCQNHQKAGAWFNLKNTPIIYEWPPSLSDFVATMVYFNPEEGKYVETHVPIEETHDEYQDRMPYMNFLIARGSHGKSFYHFM